METPVYGMKFHKFMIYVFLFLEAAYQAALGIISLFGLDYWVEGLTPQSVYAEYGIGLQAVDVIAGIIYLVLAVFAILTRQALAHRKAYATSELTGYFFCLALFQMAYGVAIGIALDDIQQGFSLAEGATVTIIVLAICTPYYSKREACFNVGTLAPQAGVVYSLSDRFGMFWTFLTKRTEWWDKIKGNVQLVMGCIFGLFVLFVVLFAVARF